MSFKYDLDKLLDPCGIEKLHKTITRITKPRNEYSAMSSAMEALEKATQPWNKNSVIGAAMANVAGPWDHKSSAMEALEKVIYAELSGDFPLGDSRQPTYKSLRPFDLVS